METKICIACGMPLRKPEDYPGKDETKAYCVHCARPDGSMQSYDEKLVDFVNEIYGGQAPEEFTSWAKENSRSSTAVSSSSSASCRRTRRAGSSSTPQHSCTVVQV